MDVDTATRDMTEEVQALIREVADEKGLDEDWINNDYYGLPEVTEIIGNLEWITDNSYSNIMLYIAKYRKSAPAESMCSSLCRLSAENHRPDRRA
jgi:hypothetical protein